MPEEEQNIVEIMDEDGIATQCEVYDVIEFEGKSYALLLPLDEAEEEDSELIVLEYIEEGEECYFQSIDDEAEFDRVCNYIQSLDLDEDDDFEIEEDE